jgi:hypothetical protein
LGSAKVQDEDLKDWPWPFQVWRRSCWVWWQDYKTSFNMHFLFVTEFLCLVLVYFLIHWRITCFFSLLYVLECNY